MFMPRDFCPFPSGADWGGGPGRLTAELRLLAACLCRSSTTTDGGGGGGGGGGGPVEEFTIYLYQYNNSGGSPDQIYPINAEDVLANAVSHSVTSIVGTYEYSPSPNGAGFVLLYIPSTATPPQFMEPGAPPVDTVPYAGFPNTDVNGRSYDTILLDSQLFHVYRTFGSLAPIDGNLISFA